MSGEKVRKIADSDQELQEVVNMSLSMLTNVIAEEPEFHLPVHLL